MDRNLSRWLVPLVAALALVAGACNGNETSSPTTVDADEGGDGGESADGVDECEIVTQQEAEVILGGPAEKQEASAETRVIGCIWLASDDPTKALNFEIHEGAASFPEDEFTGRADVPGAYEPVEGLGDRAFFSTAPDGGLYVLAGDTWFKLSGSATVAADPDDAAAQDARQEQLQDLAQKVLDRL